MNFNRDQVRLMISVLERTENVREKWPDEAAKKSHIRWLCKWAKLEYSESLYDLACDAMQDGVRVPAFQFPPDET